MKVWQKIMVAPGVAILFLVILGVMSYSVLNRQNTALDELYTDRFGNYQMAANSAQEISEVHSNVYRLFTWIGNLDEDKVTQITNEQKNKIDAVAKDLAQFAVRSGLAEDESKLAKSIIKQLEKYKSDLLTAIDLSTVDVSTGMSAMQTADDEFQSLVKSLDKLVQLEKKLAQASHESAGNAFSQVSVALIVLLLLALVISGWVAFFMSRVIVKPLKHAIAVADHIASGDLTQTIEVRSKDETGQLMQAMKNMNESLVNIVGQVRTGTETIAVASREIASGNADLSSRTESQASSLEETASSMEELTSTVRQNAENARQANRLVVSTADVAVKGGQVVGQVVDTMASIKESSRKISDIIGVIDGIAFQTNILALNAAVEAARAGEQGRGFAVVASEVRNLAQRSASAAKEIKGLIEDSVGKVDAGSELVDKAGHTMEEIVSSVKRVTDIMSEIAAASQEQSAGIEQVNQAITQMDDATQQNAALVEEAAAAAESLQDQAAKLADAVSVFKLEGAAYSVRPEQPVQKNIVTALPRRQPRLCPARLRGRSSSPPVEAAVPSGKRFKQDKTRAIPIKKKKQ